MFGDDLSGWTPKFANHEAGVNLRDTFQVEDGVLTVDYSGWSEMDDEFGHLYTDEDYSSYDLRLQYRMYGEQVPGAPEWALRNNGVMIHAQDPATMTLEESFPRCVEAQFNNGGEGDDRSNGNVCTPGTHIVVDGVLSEEHCIYSGKQVTKTEDWVDVLLEVRGGSSVKHYINGELTFEYSEPQIDADDPNHAPTDLPDGTVLTSGRIALQAESHPTQFRNVEIRVLD